MGLQISWSHLLNGKSLSVVQTQEGISKAVSSIAMASSQRALLRKNNYRCHKVVR